MSWLKCIGNKEEFFSTSLSADLMREGLYPGALYNTNVAPSMRSSNLYEDHKELTFEFSSKCCKLLDDIMDILLSEVRLLPL